LTGTVRSLRQALSIAAKEWRLLRRHPHGLAVLFLMPAAFVLVMSFALRDTLTAPIDLPVTAWVVEDRSPVADHWAREWQARHGMQRFDDRAALQAALRQRRVQAGIVVAEGWLDGEAGPRADRVELWLGHPLHSAAAARLRAELGFSLLQLRMRMAAAAAGPFASLLLSEAGSPELQPAVAAVHVRHLHEIDSGRALTAVQQSVPAWLIFGMFFVVIPLAGVLIQERRDGTLARLQSLGVGPAAVLGGKWLAFTALNWVQLGGMLLVGRWLVPAFGGDALSLDLAPGWFLVMVAATSAAAVGLALLIAAWTRTFDHAAALGSGLNVLLGALAGVMVPRMLMPPAMQTVSEHSPMAWALDGMQTVFLGSPDAAQIVPKALLLIAFGAVCVTGAWLGLRRRGL
jgi:ABC-2 type transport system permease protein